MSKLAIAGWVVYDPLQGQEISVKGTITLTTLNPIGKQIFTSSLSTGPGQVTAVSCEGMNKKGYKGFFISVPERVDIPGGGGAYLHFSLEEANFVPWRKNGNEYIYTNWHATNYDGPVCRPIGFIWPTVGWAWGSPTLKVELIDGWKLPPGEYNVNSNFKYTFVEQYGQNANGRDDAILNSLQASKVSVLTIQLKYEPKCRLNTNNISLLFSPMTPDNSHLKKSSGAEIQVSCDRVANISLYLRGVSPVSGLGENSTVCGRNGACQLLFDNNTGNVICKNVISVKKNVFSVFHRLGDLSAGEFNGSATMTVFYE
ncbi:hypothetical protein E4N01_23470 [Salmonella enterica]|nr:hypothetical protein [Salmonella enterica]